MRKKQNEPVIEPVATNGMAAAPAKSKTAAKPRARKSSANGTLKEATAKEATPGLGHLAQAVSHSATQDRQEVALRAYFRWLERGCPPGSAEQDWLEAERELQEA